MTNKYAIHHVDGRDYVSANDAKKILGVPSIKELRSLGCATIAIGNDKPLWSVDWIVNRAKYRRVTDSFSPDTEWLTTYEMSRDASDLQKGKVLEGTHSEYEERLATSTTLEELTKLMPPPENVPGKVAEWGAIEAAIGVTYPKSFKDFIEIYGALQWFDWLQPLVPFDEMSAEQFSKFLATVLEDNFSGDTVDSNGEPLIVSQFGTAGGWLPFMMGSDGDTYAWLTYGPAENWNVICVVNRQARVLPPISIVEMILGWLKNEPQMEELWGSVDEFRKHSPQRISMLR